MGFFFATLVNLIGNRPVLHAPWRHVIFIALGAYSLDKYVKFLPTVEIERQKILVALQKRREETDARNEGFRDEYELLKEWQAKQTPH